MVDIWCSNSQKLQISNFTMKMKMKTQAFLILFNILFQDLFELW